MSQTSQVTHSSRRHRLPGLLGGVWNRLSWNLTFSFITAAVVPVAVVVVVLVPRVRTEAQMQVFNQLYSVSELKEQHIIEWLEDRHIVLNLLLADAVQKQRMLELVRVDPRDLLAADRPNAVQQQVNDFLASALEADPQFREFFVYNTSGQVIAASDPSQIGKFLDRRPYFAASLEGEFIQPPYYEVGMEGITMLVGTPLYTPGGEVVAVLAGRPRMETLGDIMIQRGSLGQTGETYLVSAESHYLVTPSRWEAEGYPLTQAYFSEGINLALDGQNGSSIYRDYRGEMVLGSYHWLPELNVALIAEMDQQEALASFFALRNAIVAVGLAFAGLAAMVGFGLARRITHPVSRLTQVAARLTAGDFDQQAAVPRLVELGVLASTFNEMSARLKELITGQQKRLEEVRAAQMALQESEERYALVVRGVNDGIWDWNILTGEDYLSPRWKEMLGYADDELPNVEGSFFNLIHPDDLAGAREALAQHFVDHVPYTLEIRLRHKDGSYRWMLARGEALRDEHGEPVRMAGSITDVTERKKAEETLRTHSQILLSMAEGVNFADSAGIIRFTNPAFNRMFGYGQDELVGQPVSILNAGTPEENEQLVGEILTAIGRGQTWEGEVYNRKKDGTLFYTWARISGIRMGGESWSVAVQEDVTERRQIETAVRESEEKYRNLFENALVGMYRSRLDGTGFLDMNDKFCEVFGNTREVLQSKPVTSWWANPEGRKAMLRQLQAQGFLEDFEVTIVTGDGDTREVLGSAKLYPEKGYMEGIAIDITDRKRMEEALRESEVRYRELIEQASDGIFLADEKGRYVQVNRSACEMLGYSDDELLALSMQDLVPEEDRRAVPLQFDALLAGKTVLSERRLRRKDGTLVTVEISSRMLSNGLLQGIVRDITDRKRVEAELRTSLTEKEVLLREIHHRVKNNLQIISSLLDLQSRQTGDQHLKEAILESRGRVKSMALVHERLYETPDLSRIDFSDYIENLAKELMHSYRLSNSDVGLLLDLESVYLSIETAVPCGLIVNELITNALKHAFPDGRSGEVSVALKIGPSGEVVLSVTDNGIGLPPDSNPHQDKTLGLTIVTTLVNQLEASITFESENGTTARITLADVATVHKD